MKRICFATLVYVLLIGFSTHAQTSPKGMTVLGAGNPWSAAELLEPAELAAEIKAGQTAPPLILNIGAVEDIKGAKHIGAVSNAANLEKLKNAVADLPKNTVIVIYCGCCPFAKCPNIRPAFAELKKSGFTTIKVLDLPENLKTNWIAKGYPLAAE